VIAENKARQDRVIEMAVSCAALLDEKQGRETLLIDLRAVNSYLDYFYHHFGKLPGPLPGSCPGRARAHALSGLKQKNRPDYDSGWLVLDYDEIVVHIFAQETRDYYQLERLWADAARIGFTHR
jgi:ribosome-associated protein